MAGVQSSGLCHPGISWGDLDAWARMTRQEIEPHEARTLVRLGVMRANILNAEKPKPDGGKG